jgi:hypothetical protein
MLQSTFCCQISLRSQRLHSTFGKVGGQQGWHEMQQSISGPVKIKSSGFLNFATGVRSIGILRGSGIAQR